MGNLAVMNGRGGRFVAVGLTDQQAAFVREFVANGGIALKAAEAAGYSEPRSEGWRLTRNKAVLEAIRIEQARVLASEVGSASVATVLAVMRDTGAANKDKLQAARLGAEMARLIGKRPGERDREGDKDPADMTPEEINEEIQRLARETAEMTEAHAKATALEGEAVDVSDIAPDSARMPD